MVLVPALTLGIGAGFSNFFFGNTASAGSSVDPSIENIRDNFHFDEPEDTNIFNTKFYDVTFYSQAVSDGKNYYAGYDGEYYKEFGYFPLDNSQIYQIQGLGGELYQVGNDNQEVRITDIEQDGGLNENNVIVDAVTGKAIINRITFRNISTITPEIASAVINPYCSLYDTHYNDPDGPKYYQLKFATWTANSYSSDVYKETHQENGVPVNATGYFPQEVEDIPNFNFLLSEQPGLTDPYNRTTIGFYPIYSSGKNYIDVNKRKDAIAISEVGGSGDGTNTNLLSTDLNSFVPDSFSTEALIYAVDQVGDNRSLSAYRFPGIEVFKDEVKFAIINDFDRADGSWGGNSLIVQEDDHFFDWHEFNEYTDFLYPSGNINENAESFSLPKGRYNLYLFVKERTASDVEKGGGLFTGYDDCDDPFTNSSFAFQTGEESEINKFLRDSGVEIFDNFSFGASTLYTCALHGRADILYDHVYTDSKGETHRYRRDTFDYRDYYLVVEKMYSPKLLGGSNTWNYNSESSSDPLFLQSPEHQNAYETRNISLSDNVTHPYDLGNGYTLSLPGTCFSIGLSETTTEITLPTINYENNKPSKIVVGNTTTDVKPTTIDETTGEIIELGNLPVTIIRDKTTGIYRYDYYFSKNGANSDFSEGLMTLKEAIDNSQNSGDEESLTDKIYVSGGVGMYSGYLSDAPADVQSSIAAELGNHENIIVAPHSGQYNIYLRYQFQGSKPVVELYAYRIKDLTVRIFSPDDSDDEGTDIDTKDLVYREDGFVLTQNGIYNVYPKSYSQGNNDDYSLWTVCSDENHTHDRMEQKTVDYIYAAEDFVSGDPLLEDTVFTRSVELEDGSYETTNVSLIDMMNDLWRQEKILIDVVSGEYVTPTVIENGDYEINKNTILLAIYRPENFADYGDLFTGYDESTSQEVSL